MDNKDTITINIDDMSYILPSYDTISVGNTDIDNTTFSSLDTLIIDTKDININYWVEYEKQQEWVNISKAAKDNPELQRAIERVKILYHLSKEDGDNETGHQA